MKIFCIFVFSFCRKVSKKKYSITVFTSRQERQNFHLKVVQPCICRITLIYTSQMEEILGKTFSQVCFLQIKCKKCNFLFCLLFLCIYIYIYLNNFTFKYLS